jgi:hypothetical protein
MPVDVILKVTPSDAVSFLDSCIVREVRAARPDGPLVWAPQACADVIITVQPGETIAAVWDGTSSASGEPAGPGQYWLVIRYLDHATNQMGVEHVVVAYEPRPQQHASLRALLPAQLGNPLLLAIDAPASGGAPYSVALSWSTNRGFELGSRLYAALDQDALFWFSLADGSLADSQHFERLQGTLDGVGQAADITIHIPGDASLAGYGFSAQAAVLADVGLQLTNPLSFIIGY